MKAAKNWIMAILTDLIVLGVFNLLAFVLPFARGGGFWTGYGFSTLAIALAAAVSLYAFGHAGMRSKFYGAPLAMVAWPYMIIQLVLGLIEMALPFIPYRYEMLANLLLLAAFLIGLIGVNAGKEEVERLDREVQGKVFFVRSLQGEVEAMLARASDEGLRKELKALAEALRFSDPMSSPELAGLEGEIEAKVAALGEGLASEAGLPGAAGLCAELQRLLAERGRKCKLLK